MMPLCVRAEFHERLAIDRAGGQLDLTAAVDARRVVRALERAVLRFVVVRTLGIALAAPRIFRGGVLHARASTERDHARDGEREGEAESDEAGGTHAPRT